MVKKSIYINEELMKKLELIMNNENRSFNNLVIFILNKYFKNGKNE